VLPAREPLDGADLKWNADITDPEFRKNLRIFRRLIEDAVARRERGSLPQTSDETSAAARSRAERLDELVTLPSDCPLTLKTLLGRRFDLERCLIEVGDEEYLRSRAADFYSEGPGTIVTWEGLIEAGVLAGPPPLLADVMPEAPRSVCSKREPSGLDAVEQTRRMLAVLVAAKEAEDLPLRARRELKQQSLRLVVPVIALAAVLLGVAIAIVEDEGSEVLLAAAAGAAGAALGGLLRLRDEINLGLPDSRVHRVLHRPGHGRRGGRTARVPGGARRDPAPPPVERAGTQPSPSPPGFPRPPSSA
jgi:hypothetical protein